MAEYHSVGQPINEGERVVLESLRDGLPAGWYVLGNFEIFDGRRTFEADAVVVSPHGWTYVVEVKQMTVIEGNDHTLMVKDFQGGGLIPFQSPYGVTQGKARKLAGLLKRSVPAARTFVVPLIVFVTETAPMLSGSISSKSCTHMEVVDRIQEDPRREPEDPNPGDAARIFQALIKDARPLAPPNQLGPFKLVESVGGGPSWTTWLAYGMANPREQLRLKHYTVDPLLDDRTQSDVIQRAVAEAKTLYQIQDVEGILPIVSMPLEVEGGLVVVTRWPQGQSLWSHITRGLETQRAVRLFERLTRVIAGLHKSGVTHRNLSPASIFVGPNDQILVTDFDFASISGQEGVTALIGPEDLDPEFVAPEVLIDPKQTSPASDVYSLGKIAEQMFAGLGECPPALKEAQERATRTNPEDRPEDAVALAELLEAHMTPSVYQLKPGDTIDNRYVIEGDVLEGGHSLVYKAYDTRVGNRIGLKFPKPESPIDLAAESQATKNLTIGLTNNERLAFPQHLETCSTWQRGDADDRPFVNEFLILPWIDGTLLSVHLGTGLPLPECLSIGLEISQSLGFLHNHGVVHRDIKPDNIIVDRESHPWIIDFNVSISPDDAGTLSIAGTPWYQPADAAVGGPNKDVDVYALAGTLTELIAGTILNGRFVEWVEAATDLPEPVRDLLRSGLADRYIRPADCLIFADQIRQTAQAILADTDDRQTPVNGTIYSTESPNQNPVVTELVMRFSQSAISNKGTRGLSAFDSDTYVATRLDGDLIDDLLTAGPRLIIITGNAGDGKTAFIQQVERRLSLKEGARVEDLANGKRISSDGLVLQSNWDGSQDEMERNNEAVLEDFFGPFGGLGPDSGMTEHVRLIAINEGRLLDFAGARRLDFPVLATEIERAILFGESVESEWLEIVNLNLRTLTADLRPRRSIVEDTLTAFTQEKLWRTCEQCEYAGRCPVIWNVRAIQDHDGGAIVIGRIQRLLDVIRLRRQLHVTMRDLRSFLAFFLTGGKTCQEIGEYVANQEHRSLLNLAYFNNVFAASAYDTGHPSAASARGDRVLRATSELDVARFSNPIDDAKAWLGGHSMLGDDLIDRLLIALADADDTAGAAGQTTAVRILHASSRRHSHTADRNPLWERMLPFQHLSDFRAQLSAGAQLDPRPLLDAISRSDGFPAHRFQSLVGVESGSHTTPRADTYVTHPVSDFELVIDNKSDLAEYFEYEPSAVILRHRADPDTRLTIDLELYEMLMQVADGNSPSPEQRRGHWIELNVFKDRLRRLPSEQTILIDDNSHMFSVRKRTDMVGVAVEPVA